jgi:putative SOS response-associated peptidase YedK
MINAWSETLLEKPRFKQAVEKRRCLIPANGFHEWRQDVNLEMPPWIQFKTREPFAFPGLWECWIDPETNAREQESKSFN